MVTKRENHSIKTVNPNDARMMRNGSMGILYLICAKISEYTDQNKKSDKKVKRTSVSGFVKISRPIKSPAIKQLKDGFCSATFNKKKITKYRAVYDLNTIFI